MIIRFISDLHLSSKTPHSLRHFKTLVDETINEKGVLYILGDLFDIFLGEDDDNPILTDVGQTLKKASDLGVEISFIQGNHDFLVSNQFCNTYGIKLLPEIYSFETNEKQFIITHGDLLCSDDIDYLKFRQMVRDEKWQNNFLSYPLVERKKLAVAAISASGNEKSNKSIAMMDVTNFALEQLLIDYQKYPLDQIIIIHGHTHLPQIHQHHLQNKFFLRYVLSDWRENILQNCQQLPESYCYRFTVNC